jgi:hypothetical protein
VGSELSPPRPTSSFLERAAGDQAKFMQRGLTVSVTDAIRSLLVTHGDNEAPALGLKREVRFLVFSWGVVFEEITRDSAVYNRLSVRHS